MSDLWRLELTATAHRDLRRLDPEIRRRVAEAMAPLVEDWERCDVRNLRGTTDEWRLRVGDWRVRFERDEVDRVIWVLRVLHRSQAYRR